MKINKGKGAEAVYAQVVEIVKRVLVKGNIQPGTKIMSIDYYAKTLDVAMNTVVRAYRQLVKEGLLDSKKGAGFFVTRDKYRIDNERKKLINQYSLRFAEAIKACLPEKYNQQGKRINSEEEVDKILDQLANKLFS